MEQNFKRQSNKGISHLVLVILIAVGVMIGNLLSAAFIAKYIEHQAQQALTEATALTRLKLRLLNIAVIMSNTCNMVVCRAVSGNKCALFQSEIAFGRWLQSREFDGDVFE